MYRGTGGRGGDLRAREAEEGTFGHGRQRRGHGGPGGRGGDLQGEGGVSGSWGQGRQRRASSGKGGREGDKGKNEWGHCKLVRIGGEK